uniref:Uncharacterized protein n=1 Tax=Nelumbo nucifera TaxID=4432 RepID=A0A822YN02_NELNU|nr:TPA_asm: hypothetical protein HUJ06_012304 [Nelumbo nucifera]
MKFVNELYDEENPLMESKLLIERNKKIQYVVNGKHEARANNLLQRMIDQFIQTPGAAWNLKTLNEKL